MTLKGYKINFGILGQYPMLHGLTMALYILSSPFLTLVMFAGHLQLLARFSDYTVYQKLWTPLSFRHPLLFRTLAFKYYFLNVSCTYKRTRAKFSVVKLEIACLKESGEGCLRTGEEFNSI